MACHCITIEDIARGCLRTLCEALFRLYILKYIFSATWSPNNFSDFLISCDCKIVSNDLWIAYQRLTSQQFLERRQGGRGEMLCMFPPGVMWLCFSASYSKWEEYILQHLFYVSVYFVEFSHCLTDCNIVSRSMQKVGGPLSESAFSDYCFSFVFLNFFRLFFITHLRAQEVSPDR